MRKIGISIYPSNASLEDNLKYIQLASQYGYSRIFLCMISIVQKDKVNNKTQTQKIQAQKIQEIEKISQTASNLGYEIIADISSEILQTLGLSYNDLSYFKKLGITGLRLDTGFSGNEESLMTYNKDNLQIELNTSSNNAFLETIMSYHPNVHNLSSCHNFYPKKFSGLSRNIFLETSANFKKQGLRVAAFVNAPSASFGPWEVSEGLCTLEEHRYLEIDIQAKDLFYSNMVDDVIIANAFASEADLQALANVPRDILTLDIEINSPLNPTEDKIAFTELHFWRGDANEYTVRSTMPRVKYANQNIPPRNTSHIMAGDVIIENDNYARYKGELHIALKDYPNDGNSNIIGRVSESNLQFLYTIQPWQKFKLHKK